MWIEWATASTMTTTGTPAVRGLNTMPVQPANPMVVRMPKIIMTTITTTPNNERSSRAVPMSTRTNPSGKVDRTPSLHGDVDRAVEDDVAGHVIAELRVA